MGKSQKYSKNCASGFVPNSRHAVEIMGKSERAGSTGRINANGYDSFGVPYEVFSLSKMSRIERKNLERRLRSELEQVRKFQTKSACMNSDVLALSSSSDIRSCSNGQKRPALASHHRSLEVSALHKKRVPLGHNGSKTKRSIPGRVESVKPCAPLTSSNAMLMKHCESLLNRLMSHQFGWVFNTPVDIVELNIPDYFTVIKHPMDLGTVKSRITSSQYSSPMDFVVDVRLTFSSAMIYNPPGNDVHIMAKILSKYFEMRWRGIEKKFHLADNMASKSTRPTTYIETQISDQLPPLKKKKITSRDIVVKPEHVIRIMTDGEKHKLGLELEALLEELPNTIVNFLKEHSYNAARISDDEIEIDIDAFSEETLLQLRKLLDDYMLEQQKVQEKSHPCEVELSNDSGFSNSSLRPCIGNDPVEEDVDIVGGDDAPVLSYPDVVIAKDGANRSRCSSSSSSSSSSESDSSSSDSDSSSSSGSD